MSARPADGGDGQPWLMTTFPKPPPDRTYRKASGTSSKGNTRSITGRTRWTSTARSVGVGQHHHIAESDRVGALESGRSQPGRAILIRLAESLGLSLRERNDLLARAGYAPVFAESGLDEAALRPVRAALEEILYGHLPYPALVFAPYGRVVAANDAVSASPSPCGCCGRGRRNGAEICGEYETATRRRDGVSPSHTHREQSTDDRHATSPAAGEQ
ncbi:hypothetical protein GCM10010246_36990 [Streptomyces cuspidosporus]|uniref:HTH cro/C1-type domain-containing protein n=1 Tax=Streptomyces cuspidosporus TaxID=66882 RepID=A0ABN3G9L0_9ACTN